MQNMSSDTHDHGPPDTIAAQAKSILRENAPSSHPQLALWSLNLPPSWINPTCGALSGAASAFITCPLDVIKTKLQAQVARPKVTGPSGREMYRGMIGTCKTIIRQDGLIGLYRGLSPMALGYLPTWMIYMSVYDSSKDYFYDNGWHDNTTNKNLARAYSSVIAGACSTLGTNPIWVIKTRMMSQGSPSAAASARAPWLYTGVWDAARKMYKSEGPRAFYSGLGPALLGLTHVAIQFPLYEILREEFTGIEMGGDTPDLSGVSWTEGTGIFAASVISKICATSATYPHEVLRTRLQTQQRHFNSEGSHDAVSSTHHSQNVSTSKRVANSDGAAYQPRYRGIIQTFRVILRDEGGRAFYNGMGTNMFRAIPAAVITLLTFELMKRKLWNLQDEGRKMEAKEAYA